MESLKPYPTRVFLASHTAPVERLIKLLKDVYKLQSLEIETISLTAGERHSTFQRLTITNLPPIYIILLENSKVGSRRVKDIFDLVAYGKGTPTIIYVHDSAIRNFKLAVLHNFPIVLFHTDADFKAYFCKQLLGHDDQELLFVLRQKQEYVMREIVFREDFAHLKQQKSAKRESDKLEALESPPELKEAIVPTPPTKLSGFVDIARRNVSPPAADQPRSASQNNLPRSKQAWTLPADVQPFTVVKAAPRLM